MREMWRELEVVITLKEDSCAVREMWRELEVVITLNDHSCAVRALPQQCCLHLDHAIAIVTQKFYLHSLFNWQGDG